MQRDDEIVWSAHTQGNSIGLSELDSSMGALPEIQRSEEKRFHIAFLYSQPPSSLMSLSVSALHSERVATANRQPYSFKGSCHNKDASRVATKPLSLNSSGSPTWHRTQPQSNPRAGTDRIHPRMDLTRRMPNSDQELSVEFLEGMLFWVPRGSGSGDVIQSKGWLDWSLWGVWVAINPYELRGQWTRDQAMGLVGSDDFHSRYLPKKTFTRHGLIIDHDWA
ncbi:hypothetical protein B0O80DRAFT_425028 [Mortierella sp. GBAus27b]|nr:hypothetical protein B0O80DRAFT_425028 [Mortierella sp. GBAus27b]